MDVVINSNIQSPLVRTLARTKGKSESFTQHLKDNVPPVSFSKIELTPEGGSTASYNQTYKFRIPQYGYMRNFVLRFSATELPMSTDVFTEMETYLNALNDNEKGLLGVKRGTAGAAAPRTSAWMYHGLVPHDEGYSARTDANKDPWVQMWLRVAGGEDLSGASVAAQGAARIAPFRYRTRNNLWHANHDAYTAYEKERLCREGPIYAPSGGGFSATITSNTNVTHQTAANGERFSSVWDWCSQANLSKHLGALFPDSITLTTHNRPIQTIYPIETLARIYRMPSDMKRKYLAMIRPHITAGPSTDKNYDVNRSWTCYFPCFFSFFEDTSMNLDTRFVENLEVDVRIRPNSSIYHPASIGASYKGQSNPPATGQAQGTAVIGSDSKNTFFNMISFLNFDSIVPSTFTLEAICYYHNFHDTTSQAIRDANYKPNVPANLLTYNTYVENPVAVATSTIKNGGTVNVNLSCNNLVFGITFMVRRVSIKNSETYAFADYSQTIPIKQVTLTGSGQQLYKATGVEALLVDTWDHPLASIKTGKAVTNDSGLYADNHASAYVQGKPGCDTFFAYHIPFGFDQDMTYNSGSLAMQTINNPTLTIEFFPMDGWVLNDENVALSLTPLCNKPSLLGIGEDSDNIEDGNFQIEVYENFWQMTRIDSNTGSITKSLDL